MHDLAKVSGVAVATVSRIEAGKAPTIESAFRIARAFDMTVDSLFSQYAPQEPTDA